MTEAVKKFEDGEKVKWIAKMVPVPHPEGKTDRDGNILPVLRDTQRTGTVKAICSKKSYWVWLDGRNYYLEVKTADLESNG